jgi:glycosyltransferase involved in cell wall biosynthesis
MKIVLINDQLNAGGAEKVLVFIANMLKAKGHEVAVVLYLGKAALDKQIDAAIPIHYLHRKGRFDLTAMKKLKALVKDADIVHVHSRYNLRFYMMAKILLSISKPKIVFHEHMPRFTIDQFTKFLFSKVHAYAAVLQSMTNWVLQDKLVKPNNVYYLPNAVAAPKSKLLKQAKPGSIVMVGNFWHLKNQLFALDVLLQLPEYFTLDIYGMVYEADYHQQLKEKIIATGLSHRVQLIEGVTDIYSVLGKYDFAWHTSTSETGPLVLIEYMHADLPFVCSNTGDVAAVLKQTIPQIVIDSFDAKHWAAVIQDQLFNESNRALILSNLQAILQTNYSESAYYNKLIKLYQTVLQSA